MRRVDIAREHQEGTYKERKHEKRVSKWRKRYEKHEDRKEEDQNGNLNREIFLSPRNTTNEKRPRENGI